MLRGKAASAVSHQLDGLRISSFEAPQTNPLRAVTWGLARRGLPGSRRVATCTTPRDDIWEGVAPPTLSGASRTRFLAHMHEDDAAFFSSLET